MYVCICNAITDSDIRNAADAGVESVQELQASLGVAGNCGSCADLASAILEAHHGAAASQTYISSPRADQTGAYRYQPEGSTA